MDETTQTNPVDGSSQNRPAVDPVGENNPDTKEDYVKHSTYQKILHEKRNLASKHAETVARLAELESANKEKAETEMREQNRFQELLEQREKELSETRSKLDETNKSIEWADKMRAFQDSLGHSKLDSAYYSLVPVDEIKYGEDGRIDQENLLNVVNTFKTTHSRLIDEPRNDLPNQRPGLNSGGVLSVSQWKSLGSAKEMRERANEVDWSTK
jgi:hypothetical protein